MSVRTLLAPLRTLARPVAAPCTCTPLLAATLPTLRFASTQVEPALPPQAELPRAPEQSRRKGRPPKPAPNSKYTLPKGLELQGMVIRTGKMAKTCTVSVERKTTDHKTLKVFTRHSKYLVHDPKEECVDGDFVLIRNCLPVSARKRFEFVSLLKGSDARQSVLGHEAAEGAETAQGMAAEPAQQAARQNESA